MSSDTKKRILVVDDEPAMQEIAQALLERMGWEAIPALNVAMAVQVLRAKPLPDLVVLDLMLPDIDGLELLRQMREKPVFDHLPVVILSALADPERIRKGLDLGADRYITKPTMAHNLIPTVSDLLRNGRPKNRA